MPFINWDDTPGTIWLLGIINRDKIRDFLLMIVPDRRISVLTNIFRRHMEAGRTIVTDGYPSCPAAARNADCKHIIVLHINWFSNENGETTNRIGNLCSHLKADMRKPNWVMFPKLNDFLEQFSFNSIFLTGITDEQRENIS